MENEDDNANSKKLPLIIPSFKMPDMRPVKEFFRETSAIMDIFHDNYKKKISLEKDYGIYIETELANLDSNNKRMLFLKEQENKIQKKIQKAIATRMVGDQRDLKDILVNIIESNIKAVQSDIDLENLRQALAPVQNIKVQNINSTKSDSNENNAIKSKLIWKVDPPVVTKIVDYLISKECFFPKDRIKLLNIFHFEDRPGSPKVVVRGLMKRFPTVLFDLESANIIKGFKKDISAWVMNNFSSQSKDDSPEEDFVYSTVHDALNEGKSHKRLAPNHPEYIDLSPFTKVL